MDRSQFIHSVKYRNWKTFPELYHFGLRLEDYTFQYSLRGKGLAYRDIACQHIARFGWTLFCDIFIFCMQNPKGAPKFEVGVAQEKLYLSLICVHFIIWPHYWAPETEACTRQLNSYQGKRVMRYRCGLFEQQQLQSQLLKCKESQIARRAGKPQAFLFTWINATSFTCYLWKEKWVNLMSCLQK